MFVGLVGIASVAFVLPHAPSAATHAPRVRMQFSYEMGGSGQASTAHPDVKVTEAAVSVKDLLELQKSEKRQNIALEVALRASKEKVKTLEASIEQLEAKNKIIEEHLEKSMLRTCQLETDKVRLERKTVDAIKAMRAATVRETACLSHFSAFREQPTGALLLHAVERDFRAIGRRLRLAYANAGPMMRTVVSVYAICAAQVYMLVSKFVDAGERARQLRFRGAVPPAWRRDPGYWQRLDLAPIHGADFK